MKDLEKHVPEDQLSLATTQKERASQVQDFANVSEWLKDIVEADIKFVCHQSSVIHI